MSSLLNKANRKAAKLEQQLEKSKVKETKHFFAIPHYLFSEEKAICDILKFKLSSKAWGNKTKEMTSRLRDE